jgi:NTE family protein
MSRLSVALAVLTLTMSCAHYRPNQPLQQHDKKYGYRFAAVAGADIQDETFLILTFSGGGTRAAALAYGVMQELSRTKIRGGYTLLDEVELITSVSGGSFTSIAYALRERTPFEAFEKTFLRLNVQGALVRALVNPRNWFRLASPGFSRIDLATEYYDKHIFQHATFTDLLKTPRRPFHVINATEMDLGARFEFTQEQFDPICSDLQAMSVARAVAASSAFPVLLTPITLKNYAGNCGYTEPSWVENAMSDQFVNPTRFRTALELRAYLDARRRFVQLMDGGVADNIGLRGPIRALSSSDPELSVLRLMNNGKVKRVAVIVVNARTEGGVSIDANEGTPSVMAVLSTVSNAPMANYSFDTVEQLRISIENWNRDAQMLEQCSALIAEACPKAELPQGELSPVAFYRTEITFAALPAPEREPFYTMGTNYALSNAQVDALLAVGPRLLNESPDYRKLVQDLQE